MGELAGWPYWKVVSVTGQSGAGTDYQIELEIGDSAGGDFHLEGHCTNFPQDIRITDDDGTTLLNHWVEDITADPIVVHVEVKDDLGSNQNIRVYYGKSGETTASNGANTFLQWKGITTTAYLESLDISGAFIFENKIKFGSGFGIKYGLSNVLGVTDDDCYIYSHNSLGVLGACENENSETHTGWITPAQSIETYYNMKIVHSGSGVKFYKDSVQFGTEITTNLPDENMGMFLLITLGSYDQSWSFVRKYNSPEPAFSSAGAEQTPTVGAIMNQFQRANIGAELYNGVFA